MFGKSETGKNNRQDQTDYYCQNREDNSEDRPLNEESGHSQCRTTRFVLVLVLESLRAECWSTGVWEYCAFSVGIGSIPMQNSEQLVESPRISLLGLYRTLRLPFSWLNQLVVAHFL